MLSAHPVPGGPVGIEALQELPQLPEAPQQPVDHVGPGPTVSQTEGEPPTGDTPDLKRHLMEIPSLKNCLRAALSPAVVRDLFTARGWPR